MDNFNIKQRITRECFDRLPWDFYIPKMTIQILPSDVVDQIAAGEVVERPAHLVKELVENSLDAKATQITVEMADGGRCVKVTDNGHGMGDADLPLAVQRFATSKIQSSQDLWSLGSFGFRGEALASIASVSKLNLVSKTAKDKLGNLLVSNFGKIQPLEKIAHGGGTTVQVQQLFENIPARLKFLKTPAAEHQQIKNVLKALALAHENVEMKVMEAGQLWSMWPAADSRLARASNILENPHLFHNKKTKDGIQVEVVFCDPHHIQKTSKNIWIFAQNRWIQDRSLQAAVLEAYRNLLMHGEYPTCCVWVDVPPSEIDINIHPTKSAVKFVEPSKVFRAVYHALREGLERAPWVQTGFSTQPENNNASETPSILQRDLNFTGQPLTLFQDYLGRASDFSVVNTPRKPNLDSFKTVSERPIEYTISYETIETSPAVTPGYWRSLKVVGQVGLTYLVCESRDGVVFVDQHAAHERIMFEKLMNGWKKNNIEVQKFLIPLIVELPEDQRECIEKNLPEFKAFGMEIEIMGPQAVGVTAAPAGIQEKALYEVVRKTAEDLADKGGSTAFEKNLSEIFSLMACHSAVRSGQALGSEQIQELLTQMDEFPLSSFCPHGRPVSVSYPFPEIERDFGRRG